MVSASGIIKAALGVSHRAIPRDADFRLSHRRKTYEIRYFFGAPEKIGTKCFGFSNTLD
jgi:hypothetical protein